MTEPAPEPTSELGILPLTKAALGVASADTSFDTELKLYINAVLADLTQLGVGPSTGVTITGNSETYSSLLGLTPDLNSVQSYVSLRVRLLFDTPDSYFVVKAIEDQIAKAEWRINVAREDRLTTGLPTEIVIDGGTP